MNLFLVGAGFTRAVYPDAPLNSEVLEVLERGSRNSGVKELRGCYPATDIEVALTRLDMDYATSRNSDLLALRVKIEEEIATKFGQFCANPAIMDRTPWLRFFCESLVMKGDVVISLNYDCAIEGFLDLCGKWTPDGGYGSSLFCPLGEHDYSRSPVTVLKIHGSSSFVIAPYLGRAEPCFVGYEVNERIFPVSGKHRDFGVGMGKGRRYIIAPSYVKLPTIEIAYLMIDALRAAESADRMVVIGCGLRPEDALLRLLVTNFLRHPSWRTRKLIVVDPVAQRIADQLNEYWAIDVSAQVLAIEGRLQDRTARLGEVMSS